MSNVSAWSTTAASNNATPPNGAPEGMAPSTVNDVIRENMSAVRKWYGDTQGTLVTAGTGNAYTLTTNNAHATLAAQSMIVFRANHANTGAATLNVDSLGAKAIIGGGQALIAGDIIADVDYCVTYNATTDSYDLIGGAGLTRKQTGSLILLTTATASNNAAIDFTANITSTYDEYVIELLNVIPATAGDVLRMLTSANAGSSFDTAASDYATNYNTLGAAAVSGGVQNNAAAFMQLTGAVGSGANELGVSATVKLIRPSEATYTHMTFTGAYTSNTAAQIEGAIGGGRRNSAALVNAIRFFFSTGNVESGIFHLYGVRKA